MQIYIFENCLFNLEFNLDPQELRLEQHNIDQDKEIRFMLMLLQLVRYFKCLIMEFNFQVFHYILTNRIILYSLFYRDNYEYMFKIKKKILLMQEEILYLLLDIKEEITIELLLHLQLPFDLIQLFLKI